MRVSSLNDWVKYPFKRKVDAISVRQCLLVQGENSRPDKLCTVSY